MVVFKKKPTNDFFCIKFKKKGGKHV